MTRFWSLVAGFGAALWLVLLYPAALLFPFDDRVLSPYSLAAQSEPVTAFIRVILFLPGVSGESVRLENRGSGWLVVLALLVFLGTVTYLATRAVAGGWVRGAVAVAGAVLLAGALADVVAMLAAVVYLDWEWTAALHTFDLSWQPDAAFFGLLFALPTVLLLAFWWWIRRISPLALLKPELAAARVPFVADRRLVGRGARQLATWGVLPLALLAFLGGGLANYAGDRPGTLLEEVVGFTFYLRLRPTAPSDPSPFADTLAPELWLPPSILAVVFLLCVWALLGWFVAGFAVRGQHVGGPAVVIAVWAAVMVVCVLMAVLDATVSQFWSERTVGANLIDALSRSTRFGALYGWLAGLAVLVAHRGYAPQGDEPAASRAA